MKLKRQRSKTCSLMADVLPRDGMVVGGHGAMEGEFAFQILVKTMATEEFQ